MNTKMNVFIVVLLIYFVPVNFIDATCNQPVVKLNKLPVLQTSSGCKEMLENFAYFTANFTYCTIQNARPIALCLNCIDPYLGLRQVYQDILNYGDSGGELCKDELFNLDRLQVVHSGFTYVTGLWERASCDSEAKIVLKY